MIYGKHVNGYFCCIPNWDIGCEMAEPDNVQYNAGKLMECDMDEGITQVLAEAINTLGKAG